jgi:hypothetical protein
VHATVKQQAVWALGNFAGDSGNPVTAFLIKHCLLNIHVVQTRDMCLDAGALDAVIGYLNEIQSDYIETRIGVWSLSNLFRSKPCVRNLQYARKALEVLKKYVYSSDYNVTELDVTH